MPRERRARTVAHQPSAKLSKRQFAVQENAVEAVEVGAASGLEVSGREILESLNAAPATASKRERQQLKHGAFIDRITESSAAPYSKAQRRRFNRKQREQLGSGLSSIEAAISSLGATLSEDAESGAATSRQRPQTNTRAGRIGEGKGGPLTKAQRRHVLTVEKFRHPLILASPRYAADPFQTVRTHAQNTLEKQVPPA